MKKKLLQIIILVLSFISTISIKPIISKAEDVPVTTNKSAIDSSSQQLLDGTGYFKKTNYSSQYTFYYTNYNGTDVDYTTNESLYVRTINKSVIPISWYNESTGLDLENYESISIIQGKWALPKEYVTDFNGNIIPNSTGYLQESVYSDCRRYVYYVTYKNEDGVQRPVFDKHYECDIEVEKIPDYLLSADGKNEKMGILYGGIYDTSLLTYKAVRDITYYTEVKILTTEYFTMVDAGVTGKYEYRDDWYPIIYFNIDDIDYDLLLSVEFKYTYAEYKRGFFGLGDYKEVENSRRTVYDEVYFDESLEYVAERDIPYVVTSNICALLWNKQFSIERIFNEKEYFEQNKSEYKLLESGSWTFDIEYQNRIVGHTFEDDENEYFRIVKNTTQLLSVTYMYDGVLYKSDDNVIIEGDDHTPDLPTTEDLISEAVNDIMAALGNFTGQIVTVASEGMWTSVLNFFKALSPITWTIIITVIIMILIIVTKPIWQVLLTDKVLKKPQLVEQSFKMQNRQAYYKSQRRQRRQDRRDRRAARKDRRYQEQQYQKRRKDILSDREYLSNRVDKKYTHEEYLANKKAEGYTVQHQHNNYTVTHKLAGRKNEEREVKKTASWYPDYLKKEKEKLKYNKNTGEVSDESLEDLERFFKSQSKK